MADPKYIRDLATAAALSGSHFGIVDQGGNAKKVLESARKAFYLAGLEAADLSDYEEGTFTPTVQGTGTVGAGTYSTQVGRYEKIGRLVRFEIVLAWSAHTGTTNMIFAGLPFTVNTTTPAAVTANGLVFPDQLAARLTSGTTTIQLVTMASGAAIAALAIDTAVTSLHLGGSYSV